MAIFQASLYSPVSVNNITNIATLVDNSNYDTTTETSHLRALFTDIKLILVYQPDQFYYAFYTPALLPFININLSSIAGSSIIDPPSTGIIADTNEYSPPLNGTYRVTLCTVPTWVGGPGSTYTSMQAVYYNGGFWGATMDNTNQEPTILSGYWFVTTFDWILWDNGKYSNVKLFDFYDVVLPPVIPATTPTITTAKELITKCITETFCTYHNKQKLGQCVTDELRQLKILNTFYALDIWENFNEDYSAYRCVIPGCHF